MWLYFISTLSGIFKEFSSRTSRKMCLILVSTVIVLLQLSSTTAYNQCCNNGTENVLTGAFRECLEGEINLPCTERYLINPMREDVENFTIDDDDNLLIFNNKHRKQYQISPNK